MRFAALAPVALLAIGVMVACSAGNAEPQRRVRKPPAPPGVAQTIQLPGDDGRVHIVSVPGRHDTQQCLVHVGPAGSSIACLPSAEFTPPEYER